MADAQEKRAARRFALRIPVAVNRDGNSAQLEAAHIRDVSARGICFYVDSAVAQGSPIGFTLTLPPENGGGDGRIAVAAVIEEYEFLPEA
jgi:hypothetical protein